MSACDCGRGPNVAIHNKGCAIFNTPEEGDGKASHFSEGKSGVDQIPVEVLVEWGDIFTFGAKKYGRDNWKKGTDWHEFYGSALRHMFAFWGGEDIDPESGKPHVVMAIWNLGAIRYYQLHGLGKDTRYGDDDDFGTCSCGKGSCHD